LLPFLPKRNKMQRSNTVAEYILHAKNGKELLFVLCEILNSTELTETVKWGAPCYTINGKNVIGLAAFKSYVGMWFFQGALLSNKEKVLINAQENKTKALRQWRFTSLDDINDKLILKYVNEAIKNQKQDKIVKFEKSKKLIIPNELKEAFENDTALKMAFNAFTPGKQREFVNFISEAKQEKTKLSRLQKIEPLIKQGVGLNDKYRK
jgi:uncharacterized protein YdeI (YjbR/CyaY-like superfamily)